MNALFKKLKEDHALVRDLLDQIEDTTSRAVKKRQELILELKMNLIPHARAEEQILYSRMLDEDRDLQVTALEGHQEHQVADELLSELLELDPSTPLWQAKFIVLKESLNHHIKEEENEFFKKCEQHMSADYNDMLEEFESLKEELKNNLPTQEEYHMTPEEVAEARA